MPGRTGKTDRGFRKHAGLFDAPFAERSAERRKHGETESRDTIEGRTDRKPDGSTPLKQISKGIDVRWETGCSSLQRTTQPARAMLSRAGCRDGKSAIGSRGKVGADRTPRRLFAAMAG